MYAYCVLQGTDLSPLAHWDRDCIRAREVSNSYQHITERACMCALTHVRARSVCTQCQAAPEHSYLFLCALLLKFVLVCTLMHAVQCKCSLVMLCVYVCVSELTCVSVCTSNCFVPYGQTPAQMNIDPLWWFGQAEKIQKICTWHAQWQMPSLPHTHTPTYKCSLVVQSLWGLSKT